MANVSNKRAPVVHMLCDVCLLWLSILVSDLFAIFTHVEGVGLFIMLQIQHNVAILSDNSATNITLIVRPISL